MEISSSILSLSVLAWAFFLVSILVAPKKAILAFVCLIAGSFLLFIAVIGAKYEGLTPMKNLEPDQTYVLQTKTVDPNGKTLYILYDLKYKRNRMAFFESYPPKDHQEITQEDGRKLLVPALPTKAKDCGVGTC